MAVTSDVPTATVTYQTTTATTSHTVNYGMTPRMGSLLFLVIAAPVASFTFSLAPSAYGWTLIGENSSTSAPDMWSYFKFATGVENSTTFTTSASQSIVAHLLIYDSNTKWRKNASNGVNNATGTTTGTGGIYSTVGTGLIIATFAASNGGVTGWSSYTNSFTERADARPTGTSTNVALAVATKTVANTFFTVVDTTATNNGAGTTTSAATISEFVDDQGMPHGYFVGDEYWGMPGQMGSLGPYMSSSGAVYVVSRILFGGAVMKAYDPTHVFYKTAQFILVGFNTLGYVDSCAVGDKIHAVGAIGDATSASYYYDTYDMANDTAGTTVTVASGLVGVSSQMINVAARSTGSDVIVFYNTTPVTTMSKTYGRVAARRIAGGTTVGAQTAIGLDPASTTAQSESVDSAFLASSDRVHLVWTQTSATAGAASTVKSRTVKSTDNLGGTSPATAAVNISTSALSNTTAEDIIRASGTGNYGDGTIGVPLVNSSNLPVYASATDADSPTWSVSSQVSVNNVIRISDNFDRTSTTTLGTSSSGTAWGTPTNGTWGTSGTQAYVVSSTAVSIAPISAYNSDGWVQCTIGGTPVDNMGIVFRYSNSTNYWYMYRSAAFGTWNINKVVSGTSTFVTNLGLQNTSAGAVIKVEFVGSTIRAYVDGYLGATITDSALSTNTGVGLYAPSGVGQAPRWDDFYAGDAAAYTATLGGTTKSARMSSASDNKTKIIAWVGAEEARDTQISIDYGSGFGDPIYRPLYYNGTGWRVSTNTYERNGNIVVGIVWDNADLFGNPYMMYDEYIIRNSETSINIPPTTVNRASRW